MDDLASRRFEQVLLSCRGDLVRYVAGRMPADETDDLLADIWLVAWRRIDVMPTDPDAARRWVFGVAANVVRGARRSEARRRRLAQRLGGPRSSTAPTDDERLGVLAAWSALSPSDRQVLAVAGRLGPGRATAAALGITEDAAAARLHRARGRLTALLAD